MAEDTTSGAHPVASEAMDFLKDIPLEISVEIGRRQMPLGDVLALGPQAVIELGKAAGESLDVRVNGVLVAQGEAVVVNDRFGVRLTSLVESASLLRSLHNS
ncbi:MAG: flagellar motor switch protein FliN/FliY [Flavobacteriales bacterium]|jgi:flagellar motor switch protein FliN/FliY